jgi:curved DNA-binding protein CbpA
MVQRDGEVVNLAHAYRVLDVPWDASPRAIKENYRKLVKRWHPDRQPGHSEGRSDATLMTRLLNEAYARTQDAPLRKGFAAPYSGGRASHSGSGGEASGDASGVAREEYIPRDSPLDAAEYYASWKTLAKSARAMMPRVLSTGSDLPCASFWERYLARG